MRANNDDQAFLTNCGLILNKYIEHVFIQCVLLF